MGVVQDVDVGNPVGSMRTGRASSRMG